MEVLLMAVIIVYTSTIAGIATGAIINILFFGDPWRDYFYVYGFILFAWTTALAFIYVMLYLAKTLLM